MERKRFPYFLAILVLSLVGPILRSQSHLFAPVINLYLGDIIYALASYFIFGFLFPKFTIGSNVILALIFCFLIELSQLYHAPWINNIRYTRIGGYILGFGFLWSDLLAYIIGVSIGALIEGWWRRNPGIGKYFIKKWSYTIQYGQFQNKNQKELINGWVNEAVYDLPNTL